MNEEFGSDYASLYDLFYHDKDYKSECDFIESVFDIYLKDDVREILDLGCGTANHSVILTERNYDICAVDRSAYMIEYAKKKLTQNNHENDIDFYTCDIKEFSIDKKFDAVIMMFTVLGYQVENKDLLNVLKIVRKHLKSGGLFLFDFWYGPAVVNLKPTKRVKEINQDNTTIVRESDSILDCSSNVCKVKFSTKLFKDDALIKKFDENHTMRYFYPEELNLYLKNNNLELKKISAFLDLGKNADLTTWNCIGIAQAI